MASQALYLRWRPSTFDEMVGQEHITRTLRNALNNDRLSHAYLFSGPRGTGKTTTARLIAKAVNCLNEDVGQRPDNTCRICEAVNVGRFLDIIEIDAASHTGVDDVRELRDKVVFAPNEGRYKVYIIDEVHRFSGAAFDALLKTIEEPPGHAIFVLATTEIHKVPATILSRCQRFDFQRIAQAQMVAHLQAIAEKEDFQVEAGALELVARQATGSLRDAISLLDQLVAGPGDTLTVDRVHAVLGTVIQEGVRFLVDALLSGDTAGGLNYINQMLEESADPRQFARQIVDYLRLVMLVKTGGEDLAAGEVSEETLYAIAQQAGYFSSGALLEALRAFNAAAHDTRGGWLPQLPLEIAFLDSVAVQHNLPVATGAAPQPAPAVTPASPAAGNTPAPSQQQAAPPAPAAFDSPQQVTLSDVQARWNQLLDIAKQLDKKAPALLKAGRVGAVQDGVVTLYVKTEVLQNIVLEENNLAILHEALQRLFGVPLQLNCFVQAGDYDAGHDNLLADDPVIASMVNDLGGQVSNVESGDE